MSVSLSETRRIPYNDLYLQRPVWAIASYMVTGSSPMVAMYGERSPFVPLSVEYPGMAKSRARMFVDEASNSTHHFLGISGQSAATSAYSLLTGMIGITNATQSGCLANFEVSDNGSYGLYSAPLSEADKLATRTGVIVGEPNWRQCFDLVLTEDGALYKDEIGGGYLFTRGGNRPFVNVQSMLAAQGTSAGAYSWGMGQVAHNRNTKRLVVVQPNGGVTGVSLTFRLHFFDLQNAIGRDTKISEIQTWMAACLADGARYRVADVTLNSGRCHWAANNTFDSADSAFVLCDNDELWAFKSSDTVTTGAGRGNALFRINLAGGDWKTGAYGASEAIGFVNTVQSGAAANPALGVRHMNSDDNSVIALYQHNYYFNIGMNVVMVSTKNASATSFNYAAHTGNTMSFMIAPTGYGDFVFCQTNANNDGKGPHLAFVSNEHLNGGESILSYQTNIFPSIGSQTMYGGNIVLKVQPTTEWK